MGNMIESLLNHAERRESEDASLLPSRSGVCYFYHRSKRYNVTIAYQRRADNTVAYGASFCRPRDQFVKQRGREIALGRMCAYDHILANPGGARWEVHEAILDALTRESLVPYVPENFRP